MLTVPVSLTVQTAKIIAASVTPMLKMTVLRIVTAIGVVMLMLTTVGFVIVTHQMIMQMMQAVVVLSQALQAVTILVALL